MVCLVRPASTCSQALAAWRFTRSRLRLPKGWGTIAKRRSGMPSVLHSVLPSVGDSFEVNTTVVLPCFSNSMESWTLHDVQEPQSPRPVMMMSHFSSSSFLVSPGHGDDTEGFRLRTTVGS